MEVKTNLYEFSHGHKPKGWGMWMFALRYHAQDCHIIKFTGTYTEAKRHAIKKAKEIGGNYELMVLS